MTVVVEPFPRTRAVLSGEVADGFFTKGAQVSIRVGPEEVASLALGSAGTGGPVTPDTVFRVYCTTKPVTALAVAHQLDAGSLELDEPLAEHLPGVAAVADGTVSLRHVLNHTAGVHRPPALQVELLPPQRRAAMADSVPRPPGWRVGRDAAYSEWYGWALLGRLLESVTGEPLREHLRRTVLDPLGLHDTWIGMTDDEHRDVLPRLGINYDLRTMRPVPMLVERGARMCGEVNPAHGGYTTARDLSRLYQAVLAGLAGADEPGLPAVPTLATMTSPARPVVPDAVLGRPCSYGLGFMTELADHVFGRWCSPASFGHSGKVGATFAFADPAHSLAVGVVLNGVVDHESAFVRRPRLIRAVYEDLADELGETALDGPAVDTDHRPKRRWSRRSRSPAD